MSLDGPRNQFDGELAALQSRQEMESLSTSSVSTVLSTIADVAGQFGVPGAGLFARVLKSSQTPVEKVVEQLENGAYAEIVRIRKHYEEQDARLKEFEARLRSQEAQSAYLGAVLHGLRTSDPRKHIRLGTLTINCVYANDLEPESLDDMMRAAVELKESDIAFLGLIYDAQVEETVRQSSRRGPSFWKHNFDSVWRAFVEGGKLDSRLHLQYRSSLCRMEAAGLLMRVELSVGYGFGLEPHALLPEGAKFYERLQEIGATK